MTRMALLLLTLAAPLALAACSTIQNHDMPPDIVGGQAPP
jgi:hypothetical protein